MLDIYTLGEDVLRKECSEVKVFDSALKMLADAMLETLEEADGVGLAGPQVGVSERIFVIHIPDNPPIVFVNPEIIQTSIETSPYEEEDRLPAVFTACEHRNKGKERGTYGGGGYGDRADRLFP